MAEAPTWREDWDTLAQYMGIEGEAKENMMASIERYNELAKAGVDEDFWKGSRVLFTLDTPPFMGVVAGNLTMWVVLWSRSVAS